ncbi:MAG: tetratricopeptide repeat protein [Deltaproteobacteria bacterium]|nr:tetratricopeptide repeat protein [Deltaproteobacteria bacterium]
MKRALLALAVCALPGCLLQSEGELMQADIKALRKQLDAVKAGVDEDREALRAAIVRAEKKTLEVHEALEQLNSSARRTDADLGIQLDALQKTVQELTGKLEELNFKLAQIERAEKSGNTPVASEVKPMELDPTPPEPKQPLPSDKKAAAELVVRMLQARETPKREEGKRLAADALARWPKDEGTTDVIRLALGDRLADEKQFQKAVVEYKKVLDVFPKGVRADSAMYKIAQAFTLMGYHEDAKVFFEELLRRYPKSELTKDTKARLVELEKAKKDKRDKKK